MVATYRHAGFLPDSPAHFAREGPRIQQRGKGEMRLLSWIGFATLAFTISNAEAQPQLKDSVRATRSQSLTARQHWTEERLDEARAFPVPVLDPATLDTTSPA